MRRVSYYGSNETCYLRFFVWFVFLQTMSMKTAHSIYCLSHLTISIWKGPCKKFHCIRPGLHCVTVDLGFDTRVSCVVCACTRLLLHCSAGVSFFSAEQRLLVFMDICGRFPVARTPCYVVLFLLSYDHCCCAYALSAYTATGAVSRTPSHKLSKALFVYLKFGFGFYWICLLL